MWTPGKVVCRIDDIVPLVAQWEKSTHPAQTRLHGCLADLKARLQPLPPAPVPLFLHLHVFGKSQATLLRQNDLENFLTPLFGRRWLDPRRFELVIGTKDAFSPSFFIVGIAEPLAKPIEPSVWSRCRVTPVGSSQSKGWKEQLRQALIACGDQPFADGAIECQIAIHCSTRRNWTALWKAVGDAMGPVLGYTNASNPFHSRVRLLFRKGCYHYPFLLADTRVLTGPMFSNVALSLSNSR
jgi:hypothetical protein